MVNDFNRMNKLMDILGNGLAIFSENLYDKSTYTINHVIFNGPATIVFWEDGKKTVVKRKNGDHDNRSMAIMYAIMKRMFGSTSAVNRYIDKVVTEAKVEEPENLYSLERRTMNLKKFLSTYLDYDTKAEIVVMDNDGHITRTTSIMSVSTFMGDDSNYIIHDSLMVVLVEPHTYTTKFGLSKQYLKIFCTTGINPLMRTEVRKKGVSND